MSEDESSFGFSWGPRSRLGLCLAVAACPLALTGCGSANRPTSTPSAAGVHSEPVRFLPGGTQTIAYGRVNGAARYSLRAERYRFQRHTYFNLAVTVSELGGGSQGTNFTPQPSKPLAWSTEQGCSPSSSMWTIVFGVLAHPRDRAASVRRQCLA